MLYWINTVIWGTVSIESGNRAIEAGDRGYTAETGRDVISHGSLSYPDQMYLSSFELFPVTL